MHEMKEYSCKVLMGKPKRKRHLGRTGVDRNIMLKWILKK
jgi:hypothetical protein